VARGGEKSGYLTVQQGDKQVIPLFFEKEQLQILVDNFKKQQPALRETVKIEVAELSSIIQTLKTSDDKGLNSLVLVPSREAIAFLQSLPKGNNQQSQPQQSQPRR
jgi:nickel transport protein